MEEISLNKFKELTHHKRMKYTWKKADGTKIKEFETDKFYCNKIPGSLNMLSMPKFLLSADGKFYKDGEKFMHISEYGTTFFEVLPPEEVKSYDVQDVINAESTLEPIKCRHCKKVGNVVYHQDIGDAYCENCGKWQLGGREKE